MRAGRNRRQPWWHAVTLAFVGLTLLTLGAGTASAAPKSIPPEPLLDSNLATGRSVPMEAYGAALDCTNTTDETHAYASEHGLAAGDASPTDSCSAQATSLGAALAQVAVADAAGSSCPPKHTWTCCPCGGCGCRPWSMSPKNWCGCHP